MLFFVSPCSPSIISKFPPSSKYCLSIFISSGVNKDFGSPITNKFAFLIFSSLNSFFNNAVYNEKINISKLYYNYNYICMRSY